MTPEHEILPEGESTAKWAIRELGFLGSVKQLLNCARCGDGLPAQPYNVPRHYRRKPIIHVICDDCHEALPP